MYLILTCSSLFRKVVVQTFFFLKKYGDVDNAFAKFNDLLSFSFAKYCLAKIAKLSTNKVSKVSVSSIRSW